MAEPNPEDWELHPSPFEGRVELPAGGDLYRELTPEQLRATGGPAMETYQPSIAESLGAKAQDSLEALGASRGYSQEFGHKATTLAEVAPILGDVSAAKADLDSSNPLGASANVLGMFLGPGAKFANFGKLEKAVRMAESGARRETIHAATGWFRGVDGGWRFEIPDTGLRLNASKLTSFPRPMNDSVDHSLLFKNYPEIKNFPIFGTKSMNALGEFSPWDSTIGLKVREPEDMRATLVHELQHGVQGIEGFEGGGNPDQLKQMGKSPLEAFDMYKRNAGEAEARNTQKRLGMDWGSRAAVPPWRTSDVPEALQYLTPGDNWVLAPTLKDPFK